jgi:glycosyltransferase involved in cell wall biosynthesis
MGVYNAGRYVGEAIGSIVEQTFPDFEFIIVDDASTDSTSEVLHSSGDERIVLVENDENIGLTRSLNRGLQLARGEYIFRLDADDVSLPQRLQRQVAFLDEHPEVGLVGCAAEYIDHGGDTLGVQRVHRDPIKDLLTQHNWFNHSATAFRRKCLNRVGLYREVFRYAQDHDLWLRIAEKYDVACMEEPLVKVRFSANSIAAKQKAYQRAYSDLAIESACRRRATGRDPLDGRGIDGGFDLEEWLKLTPKSLALGCLRTACLHYLLGDIARAKDSVIEAIAHAPRLLQEREEVLKQVVGFGFGYATDLDSRYGAIRFVERVFSNLPPVASDLGRLKSRAMSEIYMASAFENFGTGNWSGVRRDVPRAIIHNPSWFRSRGAWSIFVRALTARHVAARQHPQGGDMGVC